MNRANDSYRKTQRQNRYIYIYIRKKKTHKLQVHPYKPVSWSPTHQGISNPLMSGRPRTGL